MSSYSLRVSKPRPQHRKPQEPAQRRREAKGSPSLAPSLPAAPVSPLGRALTQPRSAGAPKPTTLPGALHSQWAAATGLTIFTQQSLKEGAAFPLVAFLDAVAARKPYGRYIPAWAAMVLGPYALAPLTARFANRWQMQLTDEFMRCNSEANYGLTGKWTDEKRRGKEIATLAAAHDSSEAVVAYYSDLFRTLSIVGSNLYIVGSLVSPLVSAGFLAGGLTARGVLYCQQSRQQKRAKNEQAARTALGEHSTKAWDNILLGNRHSASLWRSEYNDRLQTWLGYKDAETTYRHAMVFVALLAAVVPALVGVWSSIDDEESTEHLGHIAVMLPRITGVLMAIYELLLTAARWEPTKARVAALNDTLDTKQVDLQTRIAWDAIEVTQADQKMSAKLFVDNAEALLSKPGRWTIRGANGSGKSSLTLLLKQRLGDEAFYLPPQGHLMLSPEREKAAGSTGQQLMAAIDSIEDRVEARILVLDEWAANLDRRNTRRISDVLDRLSGTRAIVEILHGEV
jgi:hypothetical protein